MPITEFKVDAFSFGDLLSSQSRPIYGVPDYQRRYEWGKEQVTKLWEDIIRAAHDHPEQEYFIGSVVFYPDKIDKTKRRRLIIDGQQRLATLTICIAALRDHLEKLDEKTTADAFHQHIIRHPPGCTEEHILELKHPDREYLKEYIQNKVEKRPTERKKQKGAIGRPPRNFLKEAYDYSNDEIQKQIGSKSATEKVDWLIRIATFILAKIAFITTLVESELDAYIVFETLNHRGLDLSIADLVKNHLYHKAERHGRLRDMQSVWDDIESSMKGLGDKAFSRFLRYFWLSAHGPVTQRQLFECIQKHLKDKDKSGLFKFADELKENAELYSSINLPEVKDPNVETLLDLREMGIQQHLSLLLAAKAIALSDVDFGKLVSVCEKITVRYLIAGNENPNDLEKKYSEWARNLRKHGVKEIAAIEDAATSLCAKDEIFKGNFMTLEDLNTATARYLLRRINQAVSKTKMELKSPADVHVEHILPLKPSDEWETALRDTAKGHSYAKQFGNLTLLYAPLNKSIKNRGFDTKKDAYRDSEIKITTDLCELAEWNADAIVERQMYFAELAPEVWV